MPITLEVLTTEDLTDFVDGRSEPEITEAILDLMSEDPTVSLEVYACRRQMLQMRRAFDAVMDDAAGRRFKRMLREACGRTAGNEVSEPRRA